MIKTTVNIDGMACNMCENHVCDTIRETSFKVKKVRASHKDGTAEIVSEEALDENQIKKAIEETGYKVLGIKSEPYVKKGLFGF